MGDVTNHYRDLLAADYLTMVGDFDARVRADMGLLCGLDLECESGRARALDLGCGPGMHSVALTKIGYQVTAIDLSEVLLDELKRRTVGSAVHAIQGDITELLGVVMPGFELAVCLGDTLPHLPSFEDVDRFLGEVHGVLGSRGQLLLGFRDLTHVLEGVDRFIPVAQTDDRIMTCFLEDRGDRVEVHDLIHRREESGWVLYKSSYPKLRLGEADVRNRLKAAGFEIVHSSIEQGQVKMLARKVTLSPA
ncbi:MAG: class I SAM-dependent methyltransferase [Rhodobiaceae bacterium]|nr:class I SAM-dependent methyltransferase [Rhodobiaceae bacterium]